MKKILYVDMDDVLSKTLEDVVKSYNQIYDTKYLPNDIHDWHFYRSFGHSEEEGRNIINKIFSQENFWIDLEVKRDAQSIMRTLNKVYELYVATAPFPTENCIVDKIKWIEKYFPFLSHDQLIFLYNKGLLKGDIMIDDKPANLANFDGTKILFRTPPNRQYTKFDYIVKSWNDIKELLL